MPIRRHLLIACVALLALTLLTGALHFVTQREPGRAVTPWQDAASLAASPARLAEVRLLRAMAAYGLAAQPPPAGARARLAATLAEAAAGLDAARAGIPTPQGRAAAGRLLADLAALSATLALPGGDLAPLAGLLPQLEHGFDTVIGMTAAADGALRRGRAEAAAARGLVVTAIAAATVLLIAALLARAVVPPLRQAVALARAVAAGTPETCIPPQGRRRGEAAELLRALAAIQARLQAQPMPAQPALLQAALDGMAQGLCLFDAEGRLAYANRRFAAMFGAPPPGAPVAALFPPPVLAALHPRGLSGSPTTALLPDQRRMAVLTRPLAGGGCVVTYEDVTARLAAEAGILHLARHDLLTGLPNHLALREALRDMPPLADDEQLTLLRLDLDRFRIVNDTLGHPVGDALLRAVAGRLTACARSSDLLVRQGGNEFVIMRRSPGDAAEARGLARRVMAALSEPFQVEGHSLGIAASIGIALTHGGRGGAGAPVEAARLALDRARAAGGGTFRFSGAETDAAIGAPRLLEMELRAALGRQELELFYQPLVTVADGRARGFEALLRWRHPEHGLLPPAQFVPLAEESGLIRTIGAWVLQRACADAALWPEAMTVAVNLSPAQFRDGALPGIVAAALRDSGLAAARLELEITEPLLLGDDAAVLPALHALRALGARIAMDDFGIGAASLRALRRFPLDKIKIDRSLIGGLAGDGDAAATVRAVIGLGRSLGMAVVAEGVETEAQFSTLRAQGCGEAQGYLFGRPQAGAEVPAMLRSLAGG